MRIMREKILLRGNRIVLAPVAPDDLNLIANWRNQPEIHSKFFSRSFIDKSKQGEWYERLLDSDEKIMFMIKLADTGEPVGTIGLDRIEYINRTAEFGNMVIGVKEFRGKGLAAEATNLLLEFGFKNLDMNRIYLKVFSDNASAIQLYLKCGFKSEGILREDYLRDGKFTDITLMSILKREFNLYENSFPG